MPAKPFTEKRKLTLTINYAESERGGVTLTGVSLINRRGKVIEPIQKQHKATLASLAKQAIQQ